MNMNKILAAGLVAAIAMPVASAEVCGNGGFYIGVNAGVSISKAKASGQGGDLSVITVGNANGETFKVSEDEANKVLKTSKRKTKALAELVLGYDWRLNDVMLGVDLNFGGVFGSNKLSTPKADTTVAEDGAGNHVVSQTPFARVKETINVSLMPRVGYLVTPQLEVYATAGAKFARYKVNTVKDITAEEAMVAKKSFKVVPVIGAGVRYEITPSLFTKLEYNFEFKKGMRMNKETMSALGNVKKDGSHVIKLGLGYRF